MSEDFVQWMIQKGHFDGALWSDYVATNASDPAAGCLEILRFYTGIEDATIRQHVSTFWQEAGSRAWIQSVVDAISWLDDLGFDVFVVSGTPRIVLDPLPRHLPVLPDRILALELEVDADGRFTGRHSGVPTYGEGKAQRLRDAGCAGVFLAAGNSGLDVEMLRLSQDIKWAIQPDHALRRTALDEGWVITDIGAQP